MKTRIKQFVLSLVIAVLVSGLFHTYGLAMRPTVEDIQTARSINAISEQALSKNSLPPLQLPERSKSDDSWQQLATRAYYLGESGNISPNVIPDLLPLASHENSYVRYSAITALAKVGDRTAGSTLVNALQDTDENVQAAAAIALIQLGTEIDRVDLEKFKEYLERFLSIVADDSYQIRRVDASIGEPQIDLYTAILARALEHPNWLVRHHAVEALTDLFKRRDDVLGAWAGYQSTNGLAQGLLYDAFFAVSLDRDITPTFIPPQSPLNANPSAITALGYLQEERAIPVLQQILKQVLSDENRENFDLGEIRDSTIFALGMMDVAEAGSDLLTLDPDWFLYYYLRPSTWSWRTIARDGIPFLINKLNEYRYVPPLGDLGNGYFDFGNRGDGQELERYATSLGLIGTNEAVQALLDALDSDEFFVLRSAVVAFAEVPPESSTKNLNDARQVIIPKLIDFLKDAFSINRPAYLDELELEWASERAHYVPFIIEALGNSGAEYYPQIIEAINNEIPPDVGVSIFYEAFQYCGYYYTFVNFPDGEKGCQLSKPGLYNLASYYLPYVAPAVINALINNIEAGGDLGDQHDFLLLLSLMKSESTVDLFIQYLQYSINENGYFTLEPSEYQRVFDVASPNAMSQVISICNEVMENTNQPDYQVQPYYYETTRIQCIELLGEMGSQEAILVLSKALNDVGYKTRDAAIKSLAQIGSGSVPVLTRLLDPTINYEDDLKLVLQGYDFHQRMVTIISIGENKLNHPDIVNTLSSVAMSDTSQPELRILSIETLKKLGVDAEVLAQTNEPSIQEKRDCVPSFLFPTSRFGIRSDTRYAEDDPYQGCVYTDGSVAFGAPFQSIYETIRRWLQH